MVDDGAHVYDVLPLREFLPFKVVSQSEDRSRGEDAPTLPSGRPDLSSQQVSTTVRYFWSEAFLDHVDELRLLDSTWSSELKDPIIETSQREGVRQLLGSVSFVQERNSQEAVLEGLVQHVHDFETAACSYARVIIGELGLPDDQKTIKAEKSLGFAGGEKYLVSGILFKFCLDDKGIYGGDENAAKVGGHELRGASVLFNLQIPALHVPLFTLIDIFGFRLAAVSLLPVSHRTLVYGSDDRANTVLSSDPFFNQIMAQVGASLGLKSHQVQGKSIYGAADMEGHVLQESSRYIVIDIARLFPPQSITPKSPFGSHLFRMLRPNAVRTNPVPLSSDAFCKMGTHNCKQHNQEVVDATTRMRTEIVNECSDYLNGLPQPSGELLISTMHAFGLNIRFMYLVYQVISRAWHPCILVEMSARAIKTIVRQRWRECTRQQARPSPDRCHNILLDFLNDLLPEPMSTKNFAFSWASSRDIVQQRGLMKSAWHIITVEIEKKFGFFANGGQILGLTEDGFVNHVDRKALLLRIATLLGVTFSSKLSLETNTLSFQSRLLTRSAIVRVDPVVRSIDVVTILAAKTLFLSSLRETNEPRVYDMLTEAYDMLSQLSGSAGESSALSLSIAAVLTELAMRCDIHSHSEEKEDKTSWGLSALEHLFRAMELEILTHAHATSKSSAFIPPPFTRLSSSIGNKSFAPVFPEKKSRSLGRPKWLDPDQWAREWALAVPALGNRVLSFHVMINRALLASALTQYESGDVLLVEKKSMGSYDRGERFYSLALLKSRSIVAIGHTGNVYKAKLTKSQQVYSTMLLQTGLCNWIKDLIVLPKSGKHKSTRLAAGSVTFPEIFLINKKGATKSIIENEAAVEALAFCTLGKVDCLFAGLAKGVILVWDVTGAHNVIVAQLNAHYFDIGAMCVLENSWLVTAGLDHTCSVFDLKPLSVVLNSSPSSPVVSPSSPSLPLRKFESVGPPPPPPVPAPAPPPPASAPTGIPKFDPVCVIGEEGNQVFEKGHVAGVTSVDLCRIKGHLMIVSGSFDRTARVRVLSPLSTNIKLFASSCCEEVQNSLCSSSSTSSFSSIREENVEEEDENEIGAEDDGEKKGAKKQSDTTATKDAQFEPWRGSALRKKDSSEKEAKDIPGGSTKSISNNSKSKNVAWNIETTGNCSSDNFSSSCGEEGENVVGPAVSQSSGNSANLSLQHSSYSSYSADYQVLDDGDASSSSSATSATSASSVSAGFRSNLSSLLSSSCASPSSTVSRSSTSGPVDLLSSAKQHSTTSSSPASPLLFIPHQLNSNASVDNNTPVTASTCSVGYSSLSSDAFLPSASSIPSNHPSLLSSQSLPLPSSPPTLTTAISSFSLRARVDNKITKLLGLRQPSLPPRENRGKAVAKGEPMQSTLVYTCFGHQDGIWCVRWLGSGGLLATGSSDWTVRLWMCDPFCAERRFCLRVLRGHTADVFSLQFEQTALRLITGGGDGKVKWWDLSQFSSLMKLPSTDSLTHVNDSSSFPFVLKVSDLNVVRDL